MGRKGGCREELGMEDVGKDKMAQKERKWKREEIEKWKGSMRIKREKEKDIGRNWE